MRVLERKFRYDLILQQCNGSKGEHAASYCTCCICTEITFPHRAEQSPRALGKSTYWGQPWARASLARCVLNTSRPLPSLLYCQVKGAVSQSDGTPAAVKIIKRRAGLGDKDNKEVAREVSCLQVSTLLLCTLCLIISDQRCESFRQLNILTS